MKLFLSHRTALAYWRKVSLGLCGHPAPCHVRSLVDAASNAEFIRKECAPLLQRRPTVDLLVPSHGFRRNVEGVEYHVCSSELTDGTFYHIGGNVYVSGPELVWMQLAKQSSASQLALLGCELCGTYAYDLSLGCCRTAESISDAKRLLSFSNRAQIRGGSAKVRFARNYVLNGSASPMETILMLLLCLPPKRGGYGFPLPEFNHEVRLDPKGRRMAHAQRFYIDLYWGKKKVGIEYDSRAYHSKTEKQEQDNLRRSVLEYSGVSIETATRSTVMQIDEFHGFALRMAARIGKRLHVGNDAFPHAETALRKQLLGAQL